MDGVLQSAGLYEARPRALGNLAREEDTGRTETVGNRAAPESRVELRQWRVWQEGWERIKLPECAVFG